MKILIVDNDKKLLNSVKCELKDVRYEVRERAIRNSCDYS